jgi:hypothetical protein
VKGERGDLSSISTEYYGRKLFVMGLNKVLNLIH